MKTFFAFLGGLVLFAALAAAGYLALELAFADAGEPEVAQPERVASAGGDVVPLAGAVGGGPEAGSASDAEPEFDWRALNNAAVEALGEDDPARAVELLERCLEAAPGEAIVRRNLAQALVELALFERADRPPCRDCVDLLARALELAPERADVRSLHAKWRSEAEVEADFWSESSLYFDLSYDGSRDDLLADSFKLLNLLDQEYAELRDLFGADPVVAGGPRIPVVLYRREGFDAVTGLGDWAGGAFDGTVRIPISDGTSVTSPALKRVLRHELVHAFVHAVAGRDVPGWLNEGLAQWLEPDASRAVDAAREALAGDGSFTLAELEGSLATWDDPEQIALAYAWSLVLCDTVADDWGDRVLFRMVVGCAEGRSPAETFERATNVELAAVAREL